MVDMATEMQEESGTKDGYLFMIGSNSFHPGKKTLKLTKKELGESRGKAEFSSEKLREKSGGLLTVQYVLASESCC